MNHISALAQTETQKDAPKSNLTQSLGKDDFLTLLVTQLQNQDPLNPMDPTEFTSQLAQFSSLEQLNNINENLESLHCIPDGIERLSALSMIDKYVSAESKTIQYRGEPVEIGFHFPENVKGATIYINTPDGQTICELDVPHPNSGENFIQWDGKTPDDQKVPDGTYFMTIVGEPGDGAQIQGTPLVKTQITGVDFSGPETMIITTNGTVKLSEISKVNNLTLASDDD